jgi:hypothetical protein
MTDRVFLDTNVLVYLYDADTPEWQRKARGVAGENSVSHFLRWDSQGEKWDVHFRRWDTQGAKWDVHFCAWDVQGEKWDVHFSRWDTQGAKWDVHFFPWDVQGEKWDDHFSRWDVPPGRGGRPPRPRRELFSQASGSRPPPRVPKGALVKIRPSTPHVPTGVDTASKRIA